MKPGVETLAPWLAGLAVLAVWEAACRLLGVPVYILPPPSAVLAALVDHGPLLLGSALQTLGMALAGLASAALVAGALAGLAAVSRTAAAALKPFAVAVQVTPVIAIAPLIVIWSGLDNSGRAVVILAAVVAFFPLFSSALTGLTSADPNLERLFDLHRARPWDRLIRLRLPAATPFLLEGLSIAAGQAVIGAVVAEFVAGSGDSQGLAWRILEAGHRLRTAEMFAALVVLALLGVLLHAAVGWVRRRILVAWSGV